MNRRGLTLIETLASLTLLALMGAVSASLIRSARLSLQVPDPSIHIAQLETLADTLIDQTESLQIDWERLSEAGGDAFDVPWPPDARQGAGAAREHARARIVISDQADHAWLLLEWRGAAVGRWLNTPPKENDR